MQILDVRDENDQVILASLDGSTFQVKLSWNESAGQYGLGLLDVDGNTIIDGIAVVNNFPLLWRFRRQNMPLGELCVLSSSPVGRDSFILGKAELVYLAEADLEDFGVLSAYGRI